MKCAIFREAPPLSGKLLFLQVVRGRLVWRPFSSATFFFPSRESALAEVREQPMSCNVMSYAVARQHFGAEVVA